MTRGGRGFDWTQETDFAGHVQELGAELLVRGRRRALAPLALVGQFIQALGQAALDGRHPLVHVHLAVLGRVEHVQGLAETGRLRERDQIRLAARLEEVDDLLIALDGDDDLLLGQRARVVLVDELEAALRGLHEVRRELCDLALRRRRRRLARLLLRLELVLEGTLDGGLPAWV